MRTFISDDAREARVAFVTGHGGSSLAEATLLILTAPLLLLAHARVTAKTRPYNEIFFVAVPLLVAFTVAPDELSAYAIPLLCLSSMFLLESPKPLGTVPEDDRAVTTLRGVVMLSTIICILAVDFDIFPRRFAKTEWTGTGVMDIGVGAFCFTAAIVPRRRAWSLMKTIRAVLPLYGLGLARVAFVKLTNYQEHLSEYGVAWNFFFTLIVVRVATDIASGLPPRARIALGAVMVLGYQAALSQSPLGAWVMDDGDRSKRSVWWQNKEGLATAVGYSALSVLANGISAEFPLPTVRGYFLGCALSWAALLLCTEGLGIAVSRRQCNLSFVLWIYAEGTSILLLAEAYLDHASSLMRAMSNHQLLVFLFANILTGAVNQTLNPKEMTKMTSMALLIGYVAAVCIFALNMRRG